MPLEPSPDSMLKAVQIALSADASGRKDASGMRIAENETAKNWLKVFCRLKAGGAADIPAAASDGLSGSQKAAAAGLKTICRAAMPAPEAFETSEPGRLVLRILARQCAG